MAFTGAPDTYFTIRVIIKYTSYTNKDSSVDNIRGFIQMPRRLCHWERHLYICSIWYVCAFYSMHSLSIFCVGKFLIYFSYSEVVLLLILNYIWVCIDIFLHHITDYAFKYLYMLSNLIVGCNSYCVFCPISLLCMPYSSTVS